MILTFMRKTKLPQITFLGLLTIAGLCSCGQKHSTSPAQADVEVPSYQIQSRNNHFVIDEDNVSQSINETISSATEAVSNQTTTPVDNADNTFNIIMVGDVLLHDRLEDNCRQDDGSYDYSTLFEHTKNEIAAADLAIVNQEVIIAGEALGISGYPAFNTSFNLADDLVDAGFDVILHATNHALDKGAGGILSCIDNWSSSHPDTIVLGIHDEDPQGLQNNIVTIANETGATINVAILNYTYGTNGIPMPESMPWAVDILEKEKVVSDIKAAKELADFVIVCPHWGTEYRLTPDSSQEAWTSVFLENGVDLVLGTHPHVTEPIEWLSDDSGHSMLVYYSLGNFVNWTAGEGDGVSNRMLGGMARVTLEAGGDGSVSISDYDIEALVSHVTPEKGKSTVYPLSEYTADLADNNAIISQDSNFSYEYLENLANEIFDDLWK